jgi:hypothetical protein
MRPALFEFFELKTKEKKMQPQESFEKDGYIYTHEGTMKLKKESGCAWSRWKKGKAPGSGQVFSGRAFITPDMTSSQIIARFTELDEEEIEH